MTPAETSYTAIDHTADILRALGQPARLRIVTALGHGEACVCHLEAGLGYRQAYLSQQLMVLREAGVVATRRDRKHIYYSLSHPEILELAIQMGKAFGYSENWTVEIPPGPLAGCSCPQCQAPQKDSLIDETPVISIQ